MLYPSPSSRRLARTCALVVMLVHPAAHAQTTPSASSDTLRLSLGEAVSIAMKQSDEVGLAGAQIDIADAQFGTARANLMPQLRLSGSYQHVYESARGNAVGSVFNQPNTYTGNANLSQTLFQGFRNISAKRAADENRKAARFDEHEDRALLTVAVQRAYLQALYAARVVELQAGNLVLASNRLTQVEQFERAGQAARYDVLRARVERANLEPLAIQAASDRELALLELKRLLNLPVAQPLALVSRIDPAAATAMLASIDDTVAVAERAAIRSAELNLESRRLGIKVARADYLPTLTAFFNSGYQAFPPIGYGIPTSRGALVPTPCPTKDEPNRVCQVQNGGFFPDRQAGFNLSFPVFDGFRIRSNVELAQAQTRIAEIQLQQQRETVALDAARARAELQRSRAVFTARQQNSAEAEEAFRLATLRFSRGLSTQLEVSDAQLALLTAQSTEARATYDLFLAAAELARALGRPIPIPSTIASSSSR